MFPSYFVFLGAFLLIDCLSSTAIDARKRNVVFVATTGLSSVTFMSNTAQILQEEYPQLLDTYFVSYEKFRDRAMRFIKLQSFIPFPNQTIRMKVENQNRANILTGKSNIEDIPRLLYHNAKNFELEVDGLESFLIERGKIDFLVCESLATR